MYNLSELELKVLKQYLEEKLKNGSIRPLSVPQYYSSRNQTVIYVCAQITER